MAASDGLDDLFQTHGLEAETISAIRMLGLTARVLVDLAPQDVDDLCNAVNTSLGGRFKIKAAINAAKGKQNQAMLQPSESSRVRSYGKIYESSTYVDNKLAHRVSPLMWGSQCIGTAIRVSKKGILLVRLLDEDEKDNLHEMRAFGGSVKMLTQCPEKKYTFLTGKRGEAFEILRFGTLKIGQQVTLIAYPQAEVNENLGKENKIEGVVDFLKPTSYSGWVSYSEAVKQLNGGAITIGDKLLVGMHIVGDLDDVNVGAFLPGWIIRFCLGEFDKGYYDPLDRPSLTRSKRKCS